MKARLLSVLALGGILSSANLIADTWLRTTHVSFNKPVQVPGMTLPAGSYVFQRLDANTNRGIMRVLSEDKTRTITTFRIMPAETLRPADKAEVKFSERGIGQPPAIKSITYPGDWASSEFMYLGEKGSASSSPVAD